MQSIIFKKKILTILFTYEIQSDDQYYKNGYIIRQCSDMASFLNDEMDNIKSYSNEKFAGTISDIISIHPDGSIYIDYEDENGLHYWLKFYCYNEELAYSYD